MTGPFSARRIDPVGAARQIARMIRVVSAVACVLAITAPHASFADEPAPPSDPASAPAPAPAPTVVIPPPAPVSEQPAPQPRHMRDIKIEVPGERSRNNKLVIGGVAAAGAIVSLLGVYWHLDSRDASNEVSADAFTGKAWGDDEIALVDRAERSKTRAIVAYSIGGAMLVGAVAAWIFTAPRSETAIIRTGVIVTPPDRGGGGVVSKMWSF